MFETTRPQTRNRRLFYEMLPVSLAVHAAAVGAVFVASLWTVTFPDASPKLYLAFHIDATPPPPPPPPPPPAAKPQTVVRQPVPIPQEIVAPTMIPDVIPIVENDPPPAVIEQSTEGGVEGGIEGGVIGGVVGGVLESVLADVPKPPPPSDGRVHVERDKPLAVPILSKLYPIYPNEAIRHRWEDSLVVRYVIGKDGRVKEVTIVRPPSQKVFEKPTLAAIRTWRFRPYREEGEAKEIVHELTVNFRLVPKS